MASKKTTKKKNNSKSHVVTHETDAAKTSKDAAAAKGKNFMEEKQDEDRVDAITKGINAAVGSAKVLGKEIKTTLELIEQTSNPRDLHFLLDLARRVMGEQCAVLQDELTKAKAATKKAGLKW